MPKTAIRPLTVLEIKKINKPGLHAIGGAIGLYLLVKPTGSKYYVYRFKTISGRRSMISLGSIEQLNLSDARKQAQDWKEELINGFDPSLIKRERKMSVVQQLKQRQLEEQRALHTFFFTSEEWINERSTSNYWAHNAVGEIKTQAYLDKYINPTIGDIPISDLSPHDVFEMIKPIYQSKANTSEKCLTVISSVWKWAKAKKWCTGENPADRKGSLGVLLEPYRNDRRQKINYPALDFNDVPNFFVELIKKDTISAKMTAFTILTALRSKMVRYSKWEDINLKEKTLTIHEIAIKTKGRGAHTVYLSDEAISILESTPHTSEFIFPAPRTGKPMSDASMGKVIRDLHQLEIENGHIGWIDKYQSKEQGKPVVASIHGTARASFKTWTKTGINRKLFDEEAVELCLAHGLHDDYDGAYNRATLEPERRQVMNAWGRFCFSKVTQ